MELVYHELSAGKDTSLSQVLSAWSRRYEEKYAVLQQRFSGHIKGVDFRNTDTSRPKSADLTQPSYNDFLEEIESVLQLKANLSVELEALQQIRSELEDSECMSEVHFRLERATDNNRRLHAALQAADEQITELVLSKRLLEAQMNELRNSRDAELAEAKERVRAAERAVVAATRSATSRNSVSNNESSCSIERQNNTTNFIQHSLPTTYKKPLKVHPKSYTTLTGFSYDDFDSLEEETDDDDNNNNTEKPSCELTPTVDSKQNDPKPLEEKEKPDCKTIQPVITSSNNNVDNRPNHESVMESSTENFISCKDIEAITPASSSLAVLHTVCPTSSSTPRKSLPNETVVTPFSGVNISDFTSDIIGWSNDSKPTPYTKQREAEAEVVSKAEYLKLLDEMEELRQEVDSLRQNAQLLQMHNNNISKPEVNDKEQLVSDKRPYNPGLTAQLLELKNEVASVPDDIRPNQPTNILLPCIPGSTRLYDWSLNRSDSQADTREDLNKSGESESSTDECTPVKASLSLPQSRKLSSIFKRIFARNIRITGKRVLHNSSSSSSTSVDNLTNTENNIDHVCKPTRWLSSPVLSNSKDNMKIMNFKSKIKFNRKRCKSREKDENSLKNISFQSSTDVKNATSTKIITRCDYVHKYAQTSETQCDHCVQLQAKILTYEAVNAAQKDFAKEKSIQEVISSSEAGIQCNETLQAVEVSTETHESQYMCNDDVSTQTDLEIKSATSSVCSQTDLDMTKIDDQLKSFTIGLEFYHKMIVSIIDVSEKLKHALNTHIVEQYSLMNSDTSSVSVDDDYYNNNKQVLGGEKRSELNVEFLSDLMEECNQLLSTNVLLSDSTFSEYLQTDCQSLTFTVSQLLPEIDNLLKLCQFSRREQVISSKNASPQSKQVHDNTTFSKDGSDDIENTELVRSLREQLSTAHQMLTEKLPVDTKNALLETSQIVETERIQLQAEMDRRMLEFERNHNASVIELEANRRDLVKQLEEMEVFNRELKNEIFSVQQKLQAKERFLNEQTEERELEREEFRIELNRLKNELDAKKSQLMSYKLMEADNTDSCTTQLGMKETTQTNCIPNWINNMKLENLVQSESARPSIQLFVNSKSWNTTTPQWNKSSHDDSDDEISTGNVNTTASKDQYRYTSCENNWQPYTTATTTIPPMINNSSSFLDSRDNTPDNESIRSYSDDIRKKQTTLIDDSNAYSQYELNLCDASTQVSLEDEEIGFKYQYAKQTTNFTNQSSVAIQTDIWSAVTVDAASETSNSCEELDLIQSDSDSTATNNRYTTRNSSQPTRTTTTTRVRTFNTTAAAALLSHVIVSEEESVVTVVDEPEFSEPSPVFGDQQNSLQDRIAKYKLEIDNLRRQLEAHRKLQQNELLSIEQPKHDRDTQTLVLCRDNCMQTVKLKGIFPKYESLSLQIKHHRSLPTLHSPSFSSRAEDTGVEMSQGLVNSASVESVSLPTRKSPIVEDLISLKSDNCSSPEDENLQTVIGSPMSDKDDDMEVEIPEIIFSSNQESVNPSPNTVQDVNHDTLDSVAPGTLNPGIGNTDDAASMVPISEVSKLIEQLTDSEILIKTLRNEIDDLTKYQVELQHDYNTVHEMLVERQNDLTRVTEQLLESEGKLKSLSSQLVERKDVLSERDEDLFLLNEDKKSLELKVTELQSEIEELRRLVKCYNSENHVLSVSVQADLPNSRAVMDDKMIQVMMMPSLIDSQYRSTSDENKNMLEDTNYVLKELTIQQQQQQENGIPQLWASSTPKEEESPNSSYTSMENDTPTKTISAELNTLTNRLREESLRLATATAIATSRQPVCERSSTILVNKPVNQTEEAIKVEADTVSSPWMNEIRETYADLKEAVSEVSKMVNDNTWIKKEPSDFDDAEESMRNFVNRLLVSLSKALDSDEKLWLSALTTSVDQTYAIIQNKIGAHSNLVEPLTEGILCRIIQQLTERISAFMRREDEFRKCLVEVLHVEEASFKSELKTHINRSDTLVEEINRLTQLVSSRSEELDHANNRTNELCSQLGDLKVELIHTQHELQSKSSEVDNHLTNIEHLRSQLSEEYAKTGRLRTELESLQSAKVQVEHELSSSNNLVQELKTSLSNEKSRAQTLKVELDQLYDQMKKNTHRSPISRSAEYSINNANSNHNSVNDSMMANENRAPTDNSSSSASNLNRNIYQAINLATVHLASTRRDTIKLQNQVKELQTTAQALRLNLAEAELRLMPTLTSFVPDAALNHSSSNGIRDSQCCIPNQSTEKNKKKSSVNNTNQSELPSARFAKLKNVCTDLLSRVSMDEHGIHENGDEIDDDDDDGDDDEHDQYANSSDDDSIEENIFLGTGILNPLISRNHRNNVEHDKSFSHNNSGVSISSTRDQTQNYTSTLDKPRNKRINKVNNSNYSASNNHCQKIVDSSSCIPGYSNKLNSPIQTLPIMTTSILSSSGQLATADQTISVERYRSLYTRCLRAESYRRALSFQKRYLLLLLGNFQCSEDVVIANLGCPESRITPQVDSEDGFPSKFNSSPLHKFRTVGRVVQVIYRMKHLVNKWRRVGILNIPSMQSTPLNNTDSHRNSIRSNSYHITPFQSNSLNLQTDHATRTNRHSIGSSRTPLRELYTEESNNISGSTYRNSSDINGNAYLSNNPVYPPRTSLSSAAATAIHAAGQASPNLQSPFFDNHAVSTLASHRWRPHSSFTQSALAAAASTTSITTTNPKAIPISRQVPITSIPVCTTDVYHNRPTVRNHQSSSSSSSNLSIENRRRISTTTSSTFCRVDSTQTHTVRTISHSHHNNKNQMNPIHKRSSYS